jgi:hypothetical protein
VEVTDYYELLGLAQRASAADIKARYRVLSKQHHPDMGGSQERMARLNEAYKILSSPMQRATYDRVWQRAHAPVPKAAPRHQPAPRRQTPPSAPQSQTRAQAPQAAPAKPKPSWFRRFVLGTTGIVLAAVGTTYALNALAVLQPTLTDAPTTSNGKLTLPAAPTTVTLNPPAESSTNAAYPENTQQPPASPDNAQAPSTTQHSTSTSQQKSDKTLCSLLARHHLRCDYINDN